MTSRAAPIAFALAIATAVALVAGFVARRDGASGPTPAPEPPPAPAPAPAPFFRPAVPPHRRPYVQNVTTSSATILWKTVRETDGTVRWGAGAALDGEATSPRGLRHEVVLDGLEPATEYRYEVAIDGMAATEGLSFRTAPPPTAEATTFIALGDSGMPSRGYHEIARRLRDHPVDLIVHTGDVVYPHGQEGNYDLVVFNDLHPVLARTPLYAAIGNHDVHTQNGQPYLDNWSLPTSPAGGERYYAFSWGRVLFVSIDTQQPVAAGSPQHAFVESTLASARAKGFAWVIPFMHIGPFGSGTTGDNDAVKEHLVPLFEREGVRLVLSGHDHVYERSRERRGVTYVVTGGGGATLFAAGVGEETAFSRSVHHFVKVRADGARLRLEAIDADGAVFDTLAIAR